MNSIVAEKLLEIVLRNAQRTCLLAVAGVLFIGYTLHDSTAGSWWLYWMIVSIGCYVFRPFVLRSLIRAESMMSRIQLLGSGLYSALCGCVMGISVLFFPQLDLADRLIISLILAGFGAVSSATNVGYSPFFVAFIVPLLMPLGLLWMANPDGYLSDSMSLALGTLIVMIVLVLILLGRDNFTHFLAFVELSDRQSRLANELAAALDLADREAHGAHESNASKTRFLAAASHDLRQPVHVVSLYGAALTTLVSDTRAIVAVEDMNSAIASLASQLHALLDISQLDADGIRPDFSTVNLCSLVDDSLSEFASDASNRAVLLENRVCACSWVRTDARLLLRVLQNAISNAVKYTERGSVVLSVVMEPGSNTLVCRDTGMGMSKFEQMQAFEEFYQARNPQRDPAHGLALGLPIVARLLKVLGHELSLDSRSEVGTTVSIRFDTSAIIPNSGPVNRASPIPQHLRASSDLWLHVVDDHKPTRKSMSLLLRELGCRVTTTLSTQETEAFMGRNTPDMVLVDLRLQGEDSGIRTINSIRRINPKLPCAMTTGETVFHPEDAGLEHDVPVLHKPISYHRLVVLLESLPQMPG